VSILSGSWSFKSIHHLSFRTAIADLFRNMDSSAAAIPPFVMLSVLHSSFPQFAEKTEQGTFQQQVAFLDPVVLVHFCFYFSNRMPMNAGHNLSDVCKRSSLLSKILMTGYFGFLVFCLGVRHEFHLFPGCCGCY
jgi:hypothetical protein